MSIQISDGAKSILRTASWHERRNIDTQQQRAFLISCGFNVFPLADEFLRQFDGLRLPRLDGPLSFLNFDASAASSRIEDEDIPFLEALIREAFCPIGHGGAALLFLGFSGQMVLLNDEWFLYRHIPTLFEAMDCILGVREFPQYPAIEITDGQQPPRFR